MPSLMAVLGINTGPFRAGLNDAQLMASRAGNTISSHLGGHIGGALAGLFTVGAIEQSLEHAIEWGGQIEDIAARLGMSTTAVQAWDYALKLNNSSIEKAITVFEKLGISREKALGGDKGMIEDFKTLGVSVDDLKSKRLEDIGLIIAKTFEHGDPQKLLPSFRGIGGKSAGSLVPAFLAGLPEIAEHFEQSFLNVSEENIADLKKIDDQIKTLQTGKMSFSAKVGGAASNLWKSFGDVFVASMSGLGAITAGQNPVKAFTDYLDQQLMADNAAIQKREKIKEFMQSGGAKDTDNPDKKEAARQLKVAKEVAKLHEERDKIIFDTNLKKMSRAERIASIQRKIKQLELGIEGKFEREELGLAADPVKVAKSEIEIAKLKKELAGEEIKEDKRIKPELNQMQKHGGWFVSSPLEVSALDVAKRSEQHLRALVEHMAGTKHKTGWTRSKHGGT